MGLEDEMFDKALSDAFRHPSNGVVGRGGPLPTAGGGGNATAKIPEPVGELSKEWLVK